MLKLWTVYLCISAMISLFVKRPCCTDYWYCSWLHPSDDHQMITSVYTGYLGTLIQIDKQDSRVYMFYDWGIHGWGLEITSISFKMKTLKSNFFKNYAMIFRVWQRKLFWNNFHRCKVCNKKIRSTQKQSLYHQEEN